MNTHLYEEIRSIEDIIKDNKPMRSERITTVDEYTKLINKEDKILDLLNDVYKKNHEEVNSPKYFVSSPIHVIIFKRLTCPACLHGMSAWSGPGLAARSCLPCDYRP